MNLDVDPVRPPDTDDEPWAVPLTSRERSRDALLLAFAGLVIIGLLAYVAGRAVG